MPNKILTANGGEPVEASQTTRPVLEGVSVLAVGAEYRRSEIQKNEAYGTVTLLVSMEEAATLIFVRDFTKPRSRSFSAVRRTRKRKGLVKPRLQR